MTMTSNGQHVSYAADDDSMDAVLSRVAGLEAPLARVDSSALDNLERNEIAAQLDAAHRYPRSIDRFLKEAISLATLSREVAELCIFGLPRGDKIIPGPSIRLAEIVASAYGNLHMGKRVLDAKEKTIVGQGVAWDLEKNNRITINVERRITDRNGDRYNDDMITMTGNAASSIGVRNAIFFVVPLAYVQQIYRKVQEVAVGTQATLADRRSKVILHLTKMGVTLDRILSRVKKPSVEDIGLGELEQLIGLGTAIKNDAIKIDDAFPAVGGAPVGVNPADLEATLRAQAKPAATAATKPVDAAKPAGAAKPAARAAKPATPSPAAAATPTPTPAATSTASSGRLAPSTNDIVACAICKKPLSLSQAARFTSQDGSRLYRHAACAPPPPFGEENTDAEPVGGAAPSDSDGAPPDDWVPSDHDGDGVIP